MGGEVNDLLGNSLDRSQNEPIPILSTGKEELRMVFDKVVTLVSARGWRVNARESHCLLESSYARTWEWSFEASEDKPHSTAREVEFYACWLEASHGITL